MVSCGKTVYPVFCLEIRMAREKDYQITIRQLLDSLLGQFQI